MPRAKRSVRRPARYSPTAAAVRTSSIVPALTASVVRAEETESEGRPSSVRTNVSCCTSVGMGSTSSAIGMGSVGGLCRSVSLPSVFSRPSPGFTNTSSVFSLAGSPSQASGVVRDAGLFSTVGVEQFPLGLPGRPIAGLNTFTRPTCTTTFDSQPFATATSASGNTGFCTNFASTSIGARPCCTQAGGPANAIANAMVSNVTGVTSGLGLDIGLRHGGDLEGLLEPQALVSACDALGADLPMALKDKIWKGDFVDFGLLVAKVGIGQGALSLSFSKGSGGQLLLTPNSGASKGIFSVEVWTDAFFIFASVFLVKHPQRALELFKYASTVRLAARTFGGLGWKVYDEQFRLRQARFPCRSWASIDGELWLTTLSYARQPFRTSGLPRGGPGGWSLLCLQQGQLQEAGVQVPSQVLHLFCLWPPRFQVFSKR